MVSFLSKSCIHALRAAIVVSALDSDNYVSINDISKLTNIPFHTVTKVLRSLTEKGFLSSQCGPTGGVKLAKSSDGIFLIDLIKSIDGDELFSSCILGLSGCGTETPCAMHDSWTKVRKDIFELFSKTSLKELSDDVLNKSLRINEVFVELKI